MFISTGAVWNAVRRRGPSFKKALRAAEQDWPDVAARRRMWKAAQPFIDPERPVLLDETGVNTRIARLYGWAPVGKRCRDSVSFGHWKTMTFIAGLRLSGLTALGSSMVRWMTRLFAPILRRCRHRPRHAVMSWCSPIYLPIRSPASVMIIASRRARIFYLPPYSPDMNPIDQTSSGASGTASSPGFLTLQTPAGLDAQVWFQIAIDPVNAFGVPDMALNVAQIQETQPEAPGFPGIGQSDKQIRDLFVPFVQLRAVSVARLADGEPAAGRRNTDALHRHRFHGQLSALSWPYHFFRGPP